MHHPRLAAASVAFSLILGLASAVSFPFAARAQPHTRFEMREAVN